MYSWSIHIVGNNHSFGLTLFLPWVYCSCWDRTHRVRWIVSRQISDVTCSLFSFEKCCPIPDTPVHVADTPETWQFSTSKLYAALGPSESRFSKVTIKASMCGICARVFVHSSSVTYFFSNCQAATMEDDKFGVFVEIQFDRDLSYNRERAMNLLIAKGNVTWFGVRTAHSYL